MIRSNLIEDQLRRGRLDAKTLDSMFRRRIEEGANCSPFVSQAILAAVKEIFAVGPEDSDHQLGLGQIRLLVIAAEEPAGKALAECQKVSALLTLDAGQEDYQVRLAHGVEGLRRRRILRVTAEAREQGGLLSYEDLAFRLFNCGVRTIVRDVQELAAAKSRSRLAANSRTSVLARPTASRPCGSISRDSRPTRSRAGCIIRSVPIENYVTTFARVAFLVNKGYGDDEIAFVTRRSTPLVAAYRKLLAEFQAKPSAGQPCGRSWLASRRPHRGRKRGR